MKWRDWLKLGGLSLAVLGTGMVVKSFLPQRFAVPAVHVVEQETPDLTTMPSIEIAFLRCGSITVPELVAVRGALSLVPRTLAYSAVLVHHPRATFLYDTGLCASIKAMIKDQPFIFRNTLGGFTLEQPLAEHLRLLNLRPADLDFVLLSHLHFDHVSGIPDLPEVPLRVNRIEYDAARQQGLLEQGNGLIARLMGDNPLKFFACEGPAYEGFRCSFDLFGDGSIVLVPLPGHTAGQVGMFINRANGSRLFLLGDAAWVAENYLRPATMHPLMWSMVTSDDATARQTLIELHTFALRHPEITLIAMHDARAQEAFMHQEQAQVMGMR
ncbi:MAG: MBL fold metallo-hydrolase [Ktedonobacteraceae bacterium]|nr:MBL fold metallo-hydrolase [Ktedonobacteraceae bacterium]